MKFNTKEWSKQNEKNYTWLYNYIKTIYKDIDNDDFEFVDKYKRQIMSLIENNEKWSDNSKQVLLFTVAKYLKLFGNKKYADLYSKKGHEYMEKNIKHENQNKQDEKEIENYRNHQYFENILNNINYDEIKSIKSHYEYLLLSLLVLQPPIRTSFYTTAKFLRKKDDNDNNNNYVWITKRGIIKCYYIINNDKVKNTREYSNKNLSKIEIENKNLCNLIYDSFIKFPRKYLFEHNEKPISQNTILNYLRNITNVDKINFDIMRSSYINYFYEKNRSMDEKQKLSNQMRHSVITQQRNYLKVDKDKDELNDQEKDLKIIELQNEIINLNKKIQELQKLEIKNEDIPIDDKKYKKKRRDVIYMLNKGSLPRDSTLQKYNIVYDEQLKKYI